MPMLNFVGATPPISVTGMVSVEFAVPEDNLALALGLGQIQPIEDPQFDDLLFMPPKKAMRLEIQIRGRK